MDEPYCIASNTTADAAPDRAEVQTLGGVECHYALKGNVNDSHPEQQDRAAVYALPGATPAHFKPVMETVLARMTERWRQQKEDKDFAGGCCVMLAMLDPRSGTLAIGAQGDGVAYLVLRHKDDPRKLLIKRISSPYENFLQEDPPGKLARKINRIGSGGPVMWAKPQAWRIEDTKPFYLHEDIKAPLFKLIDVRKLMGDILEAYHKPPEAVEDYECSIILASDGITASGQDDRTRLYNIALRIAPTFPNKAQAILDYAATPLKDGGSGSKDNLSAIVFQPVAFGAGEPIAAAICDGHYTSARPDRVHDGSIAAQAMIECFEEEMQRHRAVLAASPVSSYRDAERARDAQRGSQLPRHP